MSEKLPLGILLPIAKDLYVSAALEKSPLAKLEKANKERAEILEYLADDFTAFVALLDKKLRASE